MRTIPRFLFVAITAIVLSLSPASAAEPAPGSAAADNGWLHLFDGSSLYGWNATGDWQTKGQILSSFMNRSRTIYTALPFADFVLKFDYRLNATPSGAVLRLRTTRDGQPGDNGYRVPLGDAVKGWPAGSIVDRAHSSLPVPRLNIWHNVEVEANGSHLVVIVDGQQTAEITDTNAHTGYIGFDSTVGSTLDLRNLELKPLNIRPLFDGTDLTGWKSVPFVHPAAGGMLRGLERAFGGGSAKPHNANWSVHGETIHGEKGPGALETTDAYANFILQVDASATVSKKKRDTVPAMYLRNQAGALATGYPIEIGAESGAIQGLAAPHKALEEKGFVSETIIAADRQIGIWINGNLVTLYNDTRPEASTPKQGAKTSAGVISLNLPDDAASVDYRTVALAPIPHLQGGIVTEVPEQAAAVQPTSAADSRENGSPAQVAQIAAALGVPSASVRSKSAQLVGQALASNDPDEQMKLYGQVIRMDPSNAAAIQGYKDAEQRKTQQLQQAQQQAQQQQQQAQQEQEQAQTQADRDHRARTALQDAQSAFLAGHLTQSSRTLMVAERLAPGNPLVLDLRQRINAAMSLRHRIVWLCAGGGLLGLLGLVALSRRMRHRAKFPVLQVVQGLDKGKRYPIDQEVVRIGALPQDGRYKNDIVVRDVERMVSRFHCEIHRKDGALYLLDMHSANGTLVDSTTAEPGKPCPLRRGSIIDLGGAVSLRLGYDRRRRA